jgi:hypothetical protein
MIQYGLYRCDCGAEFPDELPRWDEAYTARCPSCNWDYDEPPGLIVPLVPLYDAVLAWWALASLIGTGESGR